MAKPSREQVLADLIVLIHDLHEDWEYSGEFTPETRLLQDLGFESIDAVALGSAVEERYARSFPFAEYLARLAEQKVEDLKLGEIVDFILEHMNDR